MNDTDDEAVSMLTALGFSIDMASEALRVCDGNVQASANYLLSSGAVESSAVGTTTTTTSSTSGVVVVDVGSGIRMVHGPTSQYSVEDGKSACTCMALTAVNEFLKKPEPLTVNSSFLQTMIQSGLSSYRQMMLSMAGAKMSFTEHLSAEEVLQRGLFPDLKLSGAIQQGTLTRDAQHPQGFKRLLGEIMHHHSESTSCCCLITKPPETVMICLPPYETTTSANESFILIDSHPRPHEFAAANQAYARFHSTLEELVQSLLTIFPPTNLGPDVDPMFAAMYNAFDVYALIKRQS